MCPVSIWQLFELGMIQCNAGYMQHQAGVYWTRVFNTYATQLNSAMDDKTKS